jgi:hypothetical protein
MCTKCSRDPSCRLTPLRAIQRRASHYPPISCSSFRFCPSLAYVQCAGKRACVSPALIRYARVRPTDRHKQTVFGRVRASAHRAVPAQAMAGFLTLPCRWPMRFATLSSRAPSARSVGPRRARIMPDKVISKLAGRCRWLPHVLRRTRRAQAGGRGQNAGRLTISL